MDEIPNQEKTKAGILKAGIPSATKHVFVCIGPECCGEAEGTALWEVIKRRVRETGVNLMRTKAGCFRVCTGGPWLLVYPDGVWYGAVTPERFEVILQNHLIGGSPVTEWIAIRNGLGCVPNCVSE